MVSMLLMHCFTPGGFLARIISFTDIEGKQQVTARPSAEQKIYGWRLLTSHGNGNQASDHAGQW